MKEYDVLFKFGDVSITVEADSEEEAREIAEMRLENDNLKEDSKCYDIEVEEVIGDDNEKN